MNKHETLTQRYSTWGDKLLQHTAVLKDIQHHRTFRPITVQLAPIEACDSDCPFCSVAGRPIKSYMSIDKIEKLLHDFKTLGAKAVEITGGGNPLLYRDRETGDTINSIIRIAAKLHLDIGIITNSHNLSRIDPSLHNFINWIRISLIQLDEGKAPEDYDFNGFPEDRMGFSYIIYKTGGVPDVMSRTGRAYQGTTTESIQRIARLVELHPKIKFVRLAGDCLVQGDNKRVAAEYRPIVDEIDRWDKFFLKDIQDQDVPFDEGCYVGLLRPYVAASPEGGDYQVYVCSSYVLNTRTYNKDYSLCGVEDVISTWAELNRQFRVRGFPYEVRGNGGKGWCGTCEHCFYQNNNRLVHTVANEMPDKNFA